MTEISSSRGLRNFNAIAASACSIASFSTIGRMRCFFGPTRFRASRMKLRGTQLEGAHGLAEAHSGADEIERRARGAREVARRRTELTCVDARDPGRQLGFERLDLRQAERPRDDGVRTLEEVVDDLDLFGSGAEARKRGFERLALPRPERPRDAGVRPPEEVVAALALFGPGGEARRRVDEPLERVVGFDDLFGRRVADQVRLVVQDERARATVVEDV